MYAVLWRLMEDWQRHLMPKSSLKSEQTLTVSRRERQVEDKRKSHSRKQKQCTRTWSQEKTWQVSKMTWSSESLDMETPKDRSQKRKEKVNRAQIMKSLMCHIKKGAFSLKSHMYFPIKDLFGGMK